MKKRYAARASSRSPAGRTANRFRKLGLVRGYRFLGRATVVREGWARDEAVRRVLGEEGHPYDVHAVVFIAVARAEPLVSPGYLHVADETEMRASWKERRDDLDRAYERYLATAPPFRAPRGE
jgi:hypothetical protein